MLVGIVSTLDTLIYKRSRCANTGGVFYLLFLVSAKCNRSWPVT